MVRTSAFSSVAQWIDRGAEISRRRWDELHAMGDKSAVLEELGETWNYCREPNWDGQGALPITQDTLRTAYRFIETLPLGCPGPSVGAEPDGELTLEWHRSPSRSLSVSVSQEETLHFAAILGPNRVFGTEAFFDEFPQPIADILRRVYA